MTKKIDWEKSEKRVGSGYPAPFDAPCLSRVRHKIGSSNGLTQFGVNRLTLQPGTWSSQRHWHKREEEFVTVLAGEVVLVTDDGEEVMRAGDMAAFPAGTPNGHHFQNRSGAEAVLLEIGTDFPEEDITTYPDVDLVADAQGYRSRSGKRYP